MIFMLRATEHDLQVSKPWGDSRSYDFVVGRPRHFVAVQVKSTTFELEEGWMCTVGTCGQPYPPGSFDFLAAYVVFEDAWYIIPEEEILGMKSVSLHTKCSHSKYERYTEEGGQVTLEAVSWGKFERAQGARRAGLTGSLAGDGLPEQEAALELPALAEQTGGLALEKSKNLAEALNACLSDGQQFYAVAFDPAPAAAQDEYRSIEVKIDRPGATVRTLTGYYAEP